MFKGIALLLVLVIVLVVIYFTAKAVTARFFPDTGVWEVVDHTRGDFVDVLIVRRGEHNILVDAIPIDDDDFNEQFKAAMSEARERATIMNEKGK